MRDSPLVLVVMSRRELLRAGITAEERYNLTGHDRPLLPHWARTAGMWAIRSAAEIAEAAGVSPAAFRSFKHVWKLRVGGCALDVAEACYDAVEAAKDRPLGAVAALVAPGIGVLPVEVVLHHDAMARRLSKLEISPEQWRSMPGHHRSLWFAKTQVVPPIRT